MSSVGEQIVVELKRAREVLREYEAIPEGAFGAGMIRISIGQAESALASGNVIEILKAYEDLKTIK